MTYCDQCGTASNPNAKFCHKCGHLLQVAVEPMPTQSDDCGIDKVPGTVDQLAPIERTNAPQTVAPDLAASVTQVSTGIHDHHPWRRLFARMVDMALATPLLYLLLFYPIGEYTFVEYLLGTDLAVPLHEQPYVIGVLIFILWAPIEAGFLSAFGATFGKWAFGVRVLDSDGNRLPYGKAFSRAFGVLMYGLGFGIPLVNLIACLYSYHNLKVTGTTLWDENAKVLVSHQAWTPIRSLIAAFAVLLFLVSGVLMPVFVATLSINYWAGRGDVVSSPKAVQPDMNYSVENPDE